MADSFTYRAKDGSGALSNVATVSLTIGVVPPVVHSTGLVDPSQGLWHLFDDAGGLETSFFFGNPGDYPIFGDWDGDGVETPGMYRQSDGFVYLRNSNTQGAGEIGSSSGILVMSRLRVISMGTGSIRCRFIGRRFRRSSSSTRWVRMRAVWVLRSSRMCSGILVISRLWVISMVMGLRRWGSIGSPLDSCISGTRIRRGMRMRSSFSGILVTG
jgi:hypothetical protein